MRHLIAKLSAASTWGLFALLSLTGCESTPSAPTQIVDTELVEVKVPVEVRLPDELLEECLIPPFPERTTIAAMQDLIAQLYTSLWLCEGQREDIEARQPEREEE